MCFVCADVDVRAYSGAEVVSAVILAPEGGVVAGAVDVPDVVASPGPMLSAMPMVLVVRQRMPAGSPSARFPPAPRRPAHL